MKKLSTLFIAQAAIVAAIYVVTTYFINALNLASGAIQVRLSEALCILPVFTPAAIPGLAIGCFLSNLLTGCVIWDIVLGSIATLLGAIGTYYLRKTKFLFTIPPVIANAIIVPFVLKYAYHIDMSWLFLAGTVGAGEIISICIGGYILKKALEVPARSIFKN